MTPWEVWLGIPLLLVALVSSVVLEMSLIPKGIKHRSIAFLCLVCGVASVGAAISIAARFYTVVKT
jgi:hypothetical protein